MNNSYPTSVILKELPPEGQTYTYSRESGELNSVLKDLLDEGRYNVSIELKPIGNAFEISGKIQTHVDLECSRCGRDLDFPIADEFREIIVVEAERPRGVQGSHTASHLVNDGPYCNYVTSHHFDIADFVHEHIAASEPYVVECKKDDCEQWMEKAQVLVDRGAVPATKESPFAVLKGFPTKN